MKVIKALFKFVLWIVGIVVVLLVTLPFWISPVAKTAANIAVPKLTGSAFRLEDFNLSADWLSLATDVIVVKDITVSGLYYEQKLSVPKFSFTGGQDGQKPDDGQKPSSQAQPSVAGGGKASDKKVIIDHLLLENIVVAVGGINIPVPRIELTGIGRKSGGVTLEEAWTQISEQILGAANAIGDSAGKVVDAVKAVDVKDLKKLKDVDVKNVSDVNKAVDAVNKQLDNAGEAVNAIKGLFK